jgi:hypothetical protein
VRSLDKIKGGDVLSIYVVGTIPCGCLCRGNPCGYLCRGNLLWLPNVKESF